MPIRFYCVYCNKQLGIATRKAGAVVTCPNCQNQLRVPVPDEEPGQRPTVAAVDPARSAPTPPMKGGVFEGSDFDELLRGGEPVTIPQEPRPGSPPAAHPLSLPPGVAPLPPVEIPAPSYAAPAARKKGGLGLVLLVLLLAGGAFAGGFFLGRATAPAPEAAPASPEGEDAKGA